MADFNCPEMQEALEKISNRNYSAAVRLLIPLAHKGNPKAQCNLAALYQFGLGVNPDGRKAVELYVKVAKQNITEESLSAIAYHNLATIYITGIPGVKPDRSQAEEYKKLAKDLGFPV